MSRESWTKPQAGLDQGNMIAVCAASVLGCFPGADSLFLGSWWREEVGSTPLKGGWGSRVTGEESGRAEAGCPSSPAPLVPSLCLEAWGVPRLPNEKSPPDPGAVAGCRPASRSATPWLVGLAALLGRHPPGPRQASGRQPLTQE